MAIGFLVASLNLTIVQDANAVFGLSKCEKTKSSILKLENSVAKQIRSLARYGFLVPKSSPLAIKVYRDADALDESLVSIRNIGLKNLSCFNSRQSARLQVQDYWDPGYYADVFPLTENVAIDIRYSYIKLYGSTLS
jgi:hypothetical protein